MKVYGLTGGIGSGKSTVARLLADAGASVIDADQVARDVVVPGGVGLDRMVEAFGADVLDEDGTLDRKRLAARIFADDAARATLNGILHPLIAAETARRLAQLAHDGVAVAIYEAALLVESGAYRTFDGLLVVEATPALQEERVTSRDAVTAEDARRRIAAQATNAARRAAASLVVTNDGSLEDLRAHIAALYPRLAAGDVPRPD